MIRASLYGRLGGDPVERQTRKGTAMATASLAVNASRPGYDEAIEWFSLIAFGKQAETLLRHAKADLLAVMGSLHRRDFSDRDGLDRTGWSLTVEALVSARTVRPSGGRKRQPAQPSANHASPKLDPELDDEIPF